MKNLVVIYYGDDWDKDMPFEKSPVTKASFEDWHERGLRKNIAMFRASLSWYDQKNNRFDKAWAYRDKKWIKITDPVRPDIIFDKIGGKHDYELFDKKMAAAEKVEMFNHPLFRTMLDNKLAQYLYFGEFMPKSYFATNAAELATALAKIKTEKVVVKPLYGSGGFGISISEKGQFNGASVEFPVLVQEFIRSEHGIPGFSQRNEVSDLRMIFINHKFIYALSRIAKTGSLFTNFHQGATAVLVPETTIPNSVRQVAKKITDKLSVYPKANYSLDFIFTNSDQPFLVEINTTPGFDLLHLVGDEKTKEKHFNSFAKILNERK